MCDTLAICNISIFVELINGPKVNENIHAYMKSSQTTIFACLADLCINNYAKFYLGNAEFTQ
ncbi:6673_t:CDS:2, partial [Gigaspora margarita]